MGQLSMESQKRAVTLRSKGYLVEEICQGLKDKNTVANQSPCKCPSVHAVQYTCMCAVQYK